MAYRLPISQAIRQIERWLIATKQDRHPAIKMLHANYAVGDLDMLRQMYSDQDIMTATGKDSLALLRAATQAQDHAQLELARLCPALVPE